MADETRSIFTEKAQDKLRNPDELDEYVRVTNPSVWVVLAACITLMVGLFAWAFFGTVETSVDAVATCVDGEVVCFMPADGISRLNVGDPANVGGVLMEVVSVSDVPISLPEAREMLGSDYLTNTLVRSDWTYVVRFGCDRDPGFAEGVPISVNITVDRIAPISLIFKDA